MVTFRKIAQWAAMLLALMGIGILGFVRLEGWNFFDALYMTVTTLTTVGYGEVHPLDRIGRIYNMVLILAGMGVMLYIVGSLARVVIEGELQAVLGKRKLIKHIKSLKDHYIICGFGRIGEIIARRASQAVVSIPIMAHPAAALRNQQPNSSGGSVPGQSRPGGAAPSAGPRRSATSFRPTPGRLPAMPGRRAAATERQTRPRTVRSAAVPPPRQRSAKETADCLDRSANPAPASRRSRGRHTAPQ